VASIFYYEGRALSADSAASQPQISPKWIAADGKSFWLVWTDWAGHYCFNMQKCEVIVK